MATSLDRCSYWESPSSDVYELRDASLHVETDHVRLRAVRRVQRQDPVDLDPQDWPVMASADGNVVYEGEIAAVEKRDSRNGQIVVLKCVPPEADV